MRPIRKDVFETNVVSKENCLLFCMSLWPWVMADNNTRQLIYNAMCGDLEMKIHTKRPVEVDTFYKRERRW